MVIAQFSKITKYKASRTEHVEFCLNMGEPSSKPKYYLTTDSELVPRGKGEKNPGRGVK